MYVQCPHCECVFHLVLKVPEAEWRKQFAPNTPESEMPRTSCYACHKSRVGVSLAWAVEEHTGLLEKLS